MSADEINDDAVVPSSKTRRRILDLEPLLDTRGDVDRVAHRPSLRRDNGYRAAVQAHGHYDVGWSAIPVALYRSIPRLGSRETCALSIRRYRSSWCV